MTFILTIFFLFMGSTVANENAKRLFDDLLSTYNKLRRPVGQPNELLTIKLKLRLSQIIDVHEKDQIMTTSVWLKQQHKEDLKRYTAERIKYCQVYGGRPPKRRHRRRDFDAPRRTRNSFILFESSVWKETRNQFPELTQREVVQEIAKRWRKMTLEQKQPWMLRTQDDKVRYGRQKLEHQQLCKEMSAPERMARLQDLEAERAAQAKAAAAATPAAPILGNPPAVQPNQVAPNAPVQPNQPGV